MSKIAPHVAAAIAAGLRAPGAAQAKLAGSAPAAGGHVAAAIAAARGGGSLQAKSLARAAPPGVLQRAAAPVAAPLNAKGRRRAQADFLKTTATTLFNATDNAALMEVQTSIFDGRMFISSNYSRGNNDAALAAQVPASYVHGGTTYRHDGDRGTVVRLAGELHAEQAILYELARVLVNPNKANPSHVTVIGSKRPCSVCRRVLLAFDKALHEHYPSVHLHFVDQTGADTAVQSLSLAALAAANEDQKFRDFVATYDAELVKWTAKRLSGEEVANAVRIATAPELDDIL